MRRQLALLTLAATCPSAEILPMWWSDPPAPSPELAVADGTDKPRPIRLLTLCPLESDRGKPGQTWTLLRKQPATEPGNPPTWAPYVQLTIPEGAARLGVLVVPSQPPQVMAVDLAEQTHPWGSAQLVNLTGGAIQGWVGKRKLDLPPGGRASSEAARERRTDEFVLLAPVQGGAPRVLLSSRIILDPRRRSVVFLARRANGSVETRAIEETQAEEPETKPSR